MTQFYCKDCKAEIFPHIGFSSALYCDSCIEKYTKETDMGAEERRAFRLKLNGGKHTQKEWELLKAKHNHICLNCKEEKPLTKDHILAICEGGTDDIENIQPLCWECNRLKELERVKGKPRAQLTGFAFAEEEKSLYRNYRCYCGARAFHKVIEDTLDLSNPPFTAPLCCKCFGKVMGPKAKEWCQQNHPS